MAKKKEKKIKSQIVFDDKERAEYLTGFRKRKLERKLKSKEHLEKKLREEKVKIRAKAKEKLAQLFANDQPLPEIEHLIEPIEMYECDNTLITISTMDTHKMAGDIGITLGRNQQKIDSNENEDLEDQERIDSNDDETDSNGDEIDSKIRNDFLSGLKSKDSIKGMKRSIDKNSIKMMKKNKLFKKKEMMEKIKKQKNAKRLNKQLKKGMRKIGKRRNRPNQKSDKD